MCENNINNDNEVVILDELEIEFIEQNKLTEEQITDPDYAFKQLIRTGDGKLIIPCAKCHHCR